MMERHLAAFPDSQHECPGRSAILERQCYQYNSREKIMTNTVEATEKDFQQMIQMLTCFAVTQIIGAAAAYKIADHLAKGALSAKQIAAAEGISADATFRLLRACASLGLVTCDATLTFSATPLLSTLRSDVRGSLSSLAMAWAAPSVWLPTGRFADAVRTGERQTVPAIGAEFWDYFAQHPAEGAIFTSAMHGFTSGVAPEVTRLVDTSNVKLTVDVGGASGTLVHSLMAENTNLLGIVFDLPNVVPSAAAAATALGLGDRSKAVSGDFFASVPEADLYLLKSILHDWNDEQCVRILENCCRAMRRGGRVIVVEMLLGEIGEPGPSPIFDLLMMMILSGRERSLNEYGALLERAGLRLEKNSPTSTALSVMEAVAA